MDQVYLKKNWQKATSALEKSDYKSAISLLLKIQKKIPLESGVQFALSEAFAGAGKLSAAVRECRVGVEIAPHSLEGWLHLGRLSLAIEDGPGALEAFQKARAIDGNNLHAISGQAEALAMAKDFDGAAKIFADALELAPHHVELTIALARTYDAGGKSEPAEEVLRDACRMSPDQVALWLTLGFALRGWDRIEDAQASCEEARQHHPRSEELLAQAASFAYELRDLDKAVSLYQQLVKLNPDNPVVQNDLAQALASLGNHEDSERRFRSLTESFHFFTKPWLNIAIGKKFTQSDPDLKAMLSISKQAALPSDQKMHLNFALGKAFDDIKQFDRAFSFYRKGNQQYREQINFDAGSVSFYFDLIKDAFTAEESQRLCSFGPANRKPIFILGMPRSGTTLLEQVLCAHPQIGTAGELRDLARIARTFSMTASQPWPACINELEQDDISQMASGYLESLERQNPKDAFVIDKMPQNFLHTGLAAALFPDAILIHCIRDPLDTCLSCYFQIFPGGIDFAYDLEDLGHYFRCYQNLMGYWREILGSRLIDLRYEELVSDPRKALQPILEKLGLPWSDGFLSHQESIQRVDTLSLYQVRQPLNKESTQRWRNYEDHLEPLIHALEG
ncbi:MAG: tetratricopeptide repeat protein [Proteobacteria bacterium]|nr:tetratricopeptide repeat protein [Pseudomonadota bacterium]